MDDQVILSKVSRLLATSGIDYCEVRIEYTDSLEIHISDSSFPKIDMNQDYGGCIRIQHKGVWSFVSFTDFSQIEHYFDIAYQQAILTGQTSCSLAYEARVPIVKDRITQPQFIDPRHISLDAKVHLFSHYYHLILRQGGYISAANSNYFEKTTRLLFLNSEGSQIDQTKFDVSASFVVHVENEASRDRLCMDAGSMQGFDTILGLDDQLIDFCRIAQDVIIASVAEAGIYPVIFDPALTSQFVHEAIGHLCEADEWCINPDLMSALPFGTKLSSEKLNVYDTGEHFFTRGGLTYDDEGILCRRTSLIREGNFVGLLHNRHSASIFRSEPR
jgi:Predicted Zn-dependent proteases and their inactivated homologs